MEAFSSEASYWAGVFNRPRITVSRWPDKADFSADGSSFRKNKNTENLVGNQYSLQHWWAKQKEEWCVCEADCDSLTIQGSWIKLALHCRPFNRHRWQEPKDQNLLWQEPLKRGADVAFSPKSLKGNQSSLQFLRKQWVWGHFLKHLHAARASERWGTFWGQGPC